MKIQSAAPPPPASTTSLGYLGGARPKRPVKPRPAAKPKPPAVQTAVAPPRPAAGLSSPAGLPVDPAYDQTVAGLGSRRDQLLAGYDAQRANTMLDYGYSQDAAGAYQFDANNPLSRAAQMKRRYDQQRGMTNTRFAASGHGLSGALQGARDELNFQQLADEDRLQKSLGDFLAGIQSNKASAQSEYELGVGSAMGERVSRAPANPLYSPALPETPAASPQRAAPAKPKPKPEPKPKSGSPGRSSMRVDAVLPSKAHGGRLWKYTRRSDGKLIPIGPK